MQRHVIWLVGLSTGPEIWQQGNGNECCCHSPDTKFLEQRGAPQARWHSLQAKGLAPLVYVMVAVGPGKACHTSWDVWNLESSQWDHSEIISSPSSQAQHTKGRLQRKPILELACLWLKLKRICSLCTPPPQSNVWAQLWIYRYSQHEKTSLWNGWGQLLSSRQRHFGIVEVIHNCHLPITLSALQCEIDCTFLLIWVVRKEIEVTKLFHLEGCPLNIYRAELLFMFGEFNMAIMDMREPLMNQSIWPAHAMPLPWCISNCL